MASTTLPIPLSPSIDPPLWPITVALFAEMVRSGIIGEKEHVYLWKGRLARRMPPHRPHSNAVMKAQTAFLAILPDGFTPETEQPMALRFEPSAPAPDLKVLRGTLDDYPRDYPTTADVVLVLEVADSSLLLDRQMASVYAREGIPVYWLVNIPQGVVEVYSDPRTDEGVYGVMQAFGRDASIPVVIDGEEVGQIPVRHLLG